MRFDCAQMENEFLRKRLQQFEERLDSELTSRKELEQKVRGRRQSGSQKCLSGRVLTPTVDDPAVGRPWGGRRRVPTISCFSTSTDITNAGHRGMWKILSLHVGLLHWGRILCGIKNLNVNSGYLSSSPISALTLWKSLYLLGLGFLIYKMVDMLLKQSNFVHSNLPPPSPIQTRARAF